MNTHEHTDPLPFREEEGGIIRIGRSRVSLDIVVEEFENGLTPEDIVREYDTLQLADVYAVIAYYLRHRPEVTAYLRRREAEATKLRADIEAEQPPVPTRAELLARQQEKHHAPAGQ
jgi:uncharacterized protein (DUF433 family)